MLTFPRWYGPKRCDRRVLWTNPPGGAADRNVAQRARKRGTAGTRAFPPLVHVGETPYTVPCQSLSLLSSFPHHVVFLTPVARPSSSHPAKEGPSDETRQDKAPYGPGRGHNPPRGKHMPPIAIPHSSCSTLGVEAPTTARHKQYCQ